MGANSPNRARAVLESLVDRTAIHIQDHTLAKEAEGLDLNDHPTFRKPQEVDKPVEKPGHMEQAKRSSEASPSFVQAKAAAKSDATWGRRRRRRRRYLRRRRRTFLNRAHQFAECRGRGTYRSLEYTHVKFGQQNCLGVAVDPAKLGGK